MDYVIIILILIIVGMGWVLYKSYQYNEADKKEVALVEKEKDEYAEMGKGLVEYNQKLQAKRDAAKAKILEMFSKNLRLGSHEASQALDISGATTRRYFDDLEAEGKVKQVGKTGKKVYYSKI